MNTISKLVFWTPLSFKITLIKMNNFLGHLTDTSSWMYSALDGHSLAQMTRRGAYIVFSAHVYCIQSQSLIACPAEQSQLYLHLQSIKLDVKSIWHPVHKFKPVCQLGHPENWLFVLYVQNIYVSRLKLTNYLNCSFFYLCSQLDLRKLTFLEWSALWCIEGDLHALFPIHAVKHALKKSVT